MKTLARRHAGLLLGSLLLPLMASAAEPQPTHEYTLDNGLKVVVREDHRAPVVVSQLWYKVGSSYETPGLTGLSHALEHMMFKGSRKLGPGQASLVLRDLGAEENAFTTDDYTAYYQVLARDRLPVALELEADRMAHLALPADQFKSEIEVIKEERRLRTEDKPSALAFERFKAAAYPASGYRTPTIGWMADLQRMTIDDLRHWYQAWYAPNNATLVVVGDVTGDEVKALAQKYFGEIPRRDLPAARKPLELAEPGERRLKLHVRTQLPSLIMGFNVPTLGSSNDARSINALRLISAILDGGYSARLSARLERGEEIVAGASTMRSPAATACSSSRPRPTCRPARPSTRSRPPCGSNWRTSSRTRRARKSWSACAPRSSPGWSTSEIPSPDRPAPLASWKASASAGAWRTRTWKPYKRSPPRISSKPPAPISPAPA